MMLVLFSDVIDGETAIIPRSPPQWRHECGTCSGWDERAEHKGGNVRFGGVLSFSRRIGARLRAPAMAAIAGLPAAGLLVPLAANPASASVEKISLPFICRVEAGQIRLTPSRPKTYSVVSRAAARAVTACEDSAVAQCRTLLAHSFRMRCGAKQVAWEDVALAIGGRRTSRVWKADGRLHVEVLRPLDSASPTSAAAKARFVMPPGHAPLEIFGAHFVSADALETGGLPDRAAEAPHAGRQTLPRSLDVDAGAASGSGLVSPPRTAAQERADRLRDRTILTEPLPDVEQIARERQLADAGAAAQSWLTTIRRIGDDERGEASIVSAPATLDLMVWAMLTTLIAAAGWAAWSRQDVVVERLRSGMDARLLRRAVALAGRYVPRPRPGQRRSRTEETPYPSASVEAALREVERIIALVPTAMPLRTVLDEEIGRARQRLSVAKAAAADTAAPGQIGATAFRVMMRDLERIRRIAEGAHASLNGAGPEAHGEAQIPATLAQAYATLGINSSASEATVKKVVDALRMSWHPDFALDEADRGKREARMKQLNAAFELISSHRKVA